MTERFNEGEIVYWCHSSGNGKYEVHFGMVDVQFSDVVVIDYLVPRERRLVDGVPIDEFENEDRFRKLPKHWSYDTVLHHITYEEMTEDEKNYKLDYKDPGSIKRAYNLGYIVKDKIIFHGHIEDEITQNGFRVRKVYSREDFHIDHASIYPFKLYRTYQEAKDEVDKNRQVFLDQAAMSDYDWSVLQIKKTVERWKGITDSSELEANTYLDWLLNLDNVEDVETRIYNFQIQWKKWKNKKWNYIEL